MLDQDIEALLLKHIESCYRELAQLYNSQNGFQRNFDDFPDEVQMALFEMIFKQGMTNLRASWPKFNAAIKREDWQTAAAESRRLQVSPTRNNFVRDLLLIAYQKQQAPEAEKSKAS